MKQIIQPLVENSIKYGLNDSSGHLHITVSLQRVQGLLHIIVEDDGQGIKDYGSIHKSSLQNIEERVTIKFGDSCGLYYDEQMKGARFIIKIPVIEIVPDAVEGGIYVKPADC